VALGAIGATLVGNALLLAGDWYALALAGRLVVGIGSGAGFVAGLDLVRAGGGGPVLQGFYGAATMAGGGLALMVVPPLTEETTWRAPYWTALILAVAAAVPVLPARGLPRIGHRGEAVLRDPHLLPLGVLQAASFGLAVVAGNWAVPLLERQGVSPAAAGLAAGLILFAGVLTRPTGGLIAGRGSRRAAVVVALSGVAAGAFVLGLGGPYAASLAGAFALGLCAGIPFAIVFAAAQRARPDAPGAAVALVNGVAIATILVGTPLAGLAFELPGDGRAAFLAIACAAAAALLALRRAAL
jgi:cyanate permease